MASEEYLKRKAAYIANYQKTNYKLVAIKFRRDTEQDLLKVLEESGNASEFCKMALRFFIENMEVK